MQRFISSELLYIRFLLVEALVFILFVFFYREYFHYTGYLENPLFFIPAYLFFISFFYGVYLRLKTRGTFVNTTVISYGGKEISWSEVRLCEYVERKGRGVTLMIHSSSAALQIPLKVVRLMGESLQENASVQWRSALALPMAVQNRSQHITEKIRSQAVRSFFPLMLFSLIWSLWVWGLTPIWAVIWSCVSLVIPLIWSESVCFIVRTFKGIDRLRVAFITQLAVYICGALYLWYGIYFVGNVLGP